jgi:hypothetical protein
MKLRLSNLIIMAEPIERRSNRSRKPKVHFDDQIAESIGPSKPSKPLKSPKCPAKPLNPSARASTSAKPSISTEPSILDPIEQLCSQMEELDIEEDPKAKKKAKAVEIARLEGLGLKGVIEEVKPLKDVQFEPLNPRHHREPNSVGRVRVESVKISTRVDSPTRRVISRGGSSDNCPWCFGVLVLLGW